MAIYTLAPAIEGSAYHVRITLKDEEAEALTPVTLSWTLTNAANRIVNNREDVSISDPSDVEVVTLSGADTSITGQGDRSRTLTAEATYNSVDYGNGLPIKSSASFQLINLKAVN
ncbi:unnamed protein product [marine sediment metagenome]|uniref:Uncharacterized protein n=1 Tax=marine sediment metagenome TaxID=412755 RepID=X0VJ22_9ZZZZ